MKVQHAGTNPTTIRIQAAVAHRSMRCAGKGEQDGRSDEETLGHQMVATTFNSIAIGVGRQLISKVVRQGGSFSKYSFHSRL